MSTFDQRGQTVNYQYNAAGDINFGAVTSTIALSRELAKLSHEVQTAKVAGVLDDETALDVGYKLDKAKVEADKNPPSRNIIEEHLKGAKALLEGVTAAAGLVAGISQAAEVVRRLF